VKHACTAGNGCATKSGGFAFEERRKCSWEFFLRHGSYTRYAGEDFGFWPGPVAVGAGQIAEVDGHLLVIEMELVLDGGEGAEEQVAGVGHDGGAAGVDLVPGLELIEFTQGAIDNDSGAEFLGVDDEECSKVGLVEVLLV